MTPASTDTVTWELSGFGDEVDPDPRLQCAVLLALGASHIEVRSAWDINIVELDDARLAELDGIIRASGLGVSAVASPIGKSDLAQPIEFELGRLDRAIVAAGILGANYIRIFSFWQIDGAPVEDIRDEVITRMRRLADRAEQGGVVLLHENEKDIYGDIPERVLDIVQSVDSPALRLAWDNANFVQVGVRPFTDGFAALAPYVDYLQVKDATVATGDVVPAGEGDGELLQTITALRDRGFRGFASLEPHLTNANPLGGFTGPAGYGRAARAFRTLTDHAGVTLA
ncbi:sugar phosphate isomerase/epimerase family protein [Microbacterium murale]|uniref:Sugar phosphate isomerase/epimerase n=1 Tax=Microbacterium murale TaxID=1081040 RepID=A0ABU0PA43_9MICO|nr:sugar phosphate isomerase/epimerase family protein [Microbacterium murale]MDQ0644198.1 sugar phosphate isomerase/epimerase [Microbacterium murale]